MKVRRHEMRRGVGVVVAIICLVMIPATEAQSKKSLKQADSLETAGEKARMAVRDMLDHFGEILAGYNSIIDGEASNPQAAYKKLVTGLKDADKKINAAKKQVTAMSKEADKFFEAWERDLASISSDGVREKSATRLESAKTRYAALGETLGRARDEFAPVVRNLNDQVLYLGRDLSDEAVADLQDEAEELNRQAEEVTAKVKGMLSSADETQEEAEEAIEGAN